MLAVKVRRHEIKENPWFTDQLKNSYYYFWI